MHPDMNIRIAASGHERHVAENALMARVGRTADDRARHLRGTARDADAIVTPEPQRSARPAEAMPRWAA